MYETTSPTALKTLLQARQAAAQQANPRSKPVKGDIAGVAYTGVVSEDRAVSSYVAALEDVVLVSNSRAQLERLISVAKGKTPALASQTSIAIFGRSIPEPSPAKPRFWSSPMPPSGAGAARNGASPTPAALARPPALAGLQAAHLDELASGRAKPGCIATNLPEVGDAAGFGLARADSSRCAPGVPARAAAARVGGVGDAPLGAAPARDGGVGEDQKRNFARFGLSRNILPEIAVFVLGARAGVFPFATLMRRSSCARELLTSTASSRAAHRTTRRGLPSQRP